MVSSMQFSRSLESLAEGINMKIWVHVPVERKPPADSTVKPITPLEATVEKKSMVNLVRTPFAQVYVA